MTITVLSLCGMVSSLQFTLVIPLLPEFPELLDISGADASWLVTATLLSAAVATPIVARMADMYGKRRMLVVALIAMTIGSVLCAVQTTLFAMILGRALQGFGASLIAVGISILRDELPRDRMGTAVALMSATMGIGSALGLPLSGVLTEWLGWHSVFWFGAVAGVLLIVALFALVPESSLRTPGRFDAAGALVLSGALVCLLLPISKGNTWGWTDSWVIGLFAGSVALFALWVPLELRINQPMVDLRTASRKPVMLTNVASAFAGMAMFANMLVTVQQLQLPSVSGHGFGLSVTMAGLAMVPGGLCMVLISPFSGSLLDRWGGRPVLVAGLGVMGAAYVARIFLSNSVTEVIIGSTLVSIGTALAFAAMPTLIMSSVPITETAAANGLNSLVRSIGTSCASALVAALLASSTTEVAGAVFPSATAFAAICAMGAVASTLGAGVAFLIPVEVRAAERKIGVPRSPDETVIRGRLVLGPNTSRRPGMVAVHTLAGEQVDWARIENDGRYSVALPGEGSYVFTANAQGWTPVAQVFDFAGDETEQVIMLTDELTLRGRVSLADRSCPGAVVSLSTGDGTHLGSRACDDDGCYAFALPPAGFYLLTAVDPRTRRTRAQKVSLGVDTAVVDLELR